MVEDKAYTVGHREAIDREPAGRAGVAPGGQRHLYGSVGGLPLGGGDQIVTPGGGKGGALAHRFLEAVDVLSVGQLGSQVSRDDLRVEIPALLVRSEGRRG